MSEPFASGSVSVGLHPAPSEPAATQVDTLLEQARAVAAAGFDGVTIGEHHVGFPGYLPQPLLAVNWLLAECPGLWAAPSPILLGLRSPRLLAEELAWSAARFPGRLSATLASGYAAGDFEAAGVDASRGRRSFPTKLEELMRALAPSGPLAGDPAIDAALLRPDRLLSAANSTSAVQRAASLGLGLLFPGGQPPERLGRLADTYRRSGGRGPVVTIAALWLGDTPAPRSKIDARYATAAAPGTSEGHFERGPFTGSAGAVADELIDHVVRSRATALNIRMFADDACPAEVVAQIQLVAEGVLPAVRDALRSMHAADTPNRRSHGNR